MAGESNWKVQWNRPVGIYSGAQPRCFQIANNGPGTITVFVRNAWGGGLPSIHGVPVYPGNSIEVEGVELILQLPGFDDPRFGQNASPGIGEASYAQGTLRPAGP